MKNSKQVCLGRGLFSIGAVIAVFLMTGATAHAQQTTGVPCSPSATTTVDGKSLPVPATGVRWRDQPGRQGFQTVLASHRGTA